VNANEFARKIASDIHENCEAYFAHTISYEVWTARQRRLWQRAEDHGDQTASRVMNLICLRDSDYALTRHQPKRPTGRRPGMAARA